MPTGDFPNMKKKNSELLSVDKNYVPASADVGDEMYPNGIFVFNITKMIEYIHEHQNEIQMESIETSACPGNFSKLDEATVEKADITVPLVLAEISPGRYNVIDGNHRLEKARRMGFCQLNVYKITPKHHMQFLTSVQAYHSYVEYWNSKIKDRESRNRRRALRS
jgi:hypothetical protein